MFAMKDFFVVLAALLVSWMCVGSVNAADAEGYEFLDSTLLSGVKYDAGSSTMLIQLRDGSIIQYNGVPASTYHSLKNHHLKGGYYRGNVVGRYEAIIIEGPTPTDEEAAEAAAAAGPVESEPAVEDPPPAPVEEPPPAPVEEPAVEAVAEPPPPVEASADGTESVADSQPGGTAALPEESIVDEAVVEESSDAFAEMEALLSEAEESVDAVEAVVEETAEAVAEEPDEAVESVSDVLEGVLEEAPATAEDAADEFDTLFAAAADEVAVEEVDALVAGAGDVEAAVTDEEVFDLIDELESGLSESSEQLDEIDALLK